LNISFLTLLTFWRSKPLKIERLFITYPSIVRVKESYISYSAGYNRTGMDVTGGIGKKRGEPEIKGGNGR
jgi:hypothetical protein